MPRAHKCGGGQYRTVVCQCGKSFTAHPMRLDTQVRLHNKVCPVIKTTSGTVVPSKIPWTNEGNSHSNNLVRTKRGNLAVKDDPHNLKVYVDGEHEYDFKATFGDIKNNKVREREDYWRQRLKTLDGHEDLTDDEFDIIIKQVKGLGLI